MVPFLGNTCREEGCALVGEGTLNRCLFSHHNSTSNRLCQIPCPWCTSALPSVNWGSEHFCRCWKAPLELLHSLASVCERHLWEISGFPNIRAGRTIDIVSSQHQWWSQCPERRSLPKAAGRACGNGSQGKGPGDVQGLAAKDAKLGGKWIRGRGQPSPTLPPSHQSGRHTHALVLAAALRPHVAAPTQAEALTLPSPLPPARLPAQARGDCCQHPCSLRPRPSQRVRAQP